MTHWLPAFDQGATWGAVATSKNRERALPDITDNQLQILAGLASGRTYREIAQILGLAPKTIKNRGLVLLHQVAPDSTRPRMLGHFVEALPTDLRRQLRTQARKQLQALTPAEQELLATVANGTRVSRIAEQQRRAPKTVTTHIRTVRDKVGARTRDSAALIWHLAQD